MNNEAYSRVKDYSKVKHKVTTYFEIAKLLNEASCKYGLILKNLIYWISKVKMK